MRFLPKIEPRLNLAIAIVVLCYLTGRSSYFVLSAAVPIVIVLVIVIEWFELSNPKGQQRTTKYCCELRLVDDELRTQPQSKASDSAGVFQRIDVSPYDQCQIARDSFDAPIPPAYFQ